MFTRLIATGILLTVSMIATAAPTLHKDWDDDYWDDDYDDDYWDYGY